MIFLLTSKILQLACVVFQEWPLPLSAPSVRMEHTAVKELRTALPVRGTVSH